MEQEMEKPQKVEHPAIDTSCESPVYSKDVSGVAAVDPSAVSISHHHGDSTSPGTPSGEVVVAEVDDAANDVMSSVVTEMVREVTADAAGEIFGGASIGSPTATAATVSVSSVSETTGDGGSATVPASVTEILSPTDTDSMDFVAAEMKADTPGVKVESTRNSDRPETEETETETVLSHEGEGDSETRHHQAGEEL
jgi:hypothetical protein